VTLHRPGNVDNRESLVAILSILQRVETHGKVIFLIHPRTRKRLEEFQLSSQFSAVRNLVLTNPLGYLDFLNLMMDANIVLTDSGGIQAETTFLDVPCVTLRENTEQPCTIECGTNVLAGLDVDKVTEFVARCYEGHWKKGRVPELWDGKAAERIGKILVDAFDGDQRGLL
jgi:UDP-N-acetylglucosamine 2-epimerase (non-hydrolysing)